MTSPTLPSSGPRKLTQATGQRTEDPTDGRIGEVTAVTSRGITVNVAGALIEPIPHLGSYSPAVGDPVFLTRFRDSWLAMGRPVGPGTATDNASPGGAVGSTLLDGCVLSGSGAVMASSSGAVTPVPRYGVTFYHPPGHWVELRWLYSWFSTSTNDVLIVQLLEAYSGTALQVVETQPGGGVGSTSEYGLLVPPALGGARRSWSMTVQKFAGAGTSRIEDPAARRGKLLAYDAGDQAFIRTV